MGFDLDAFLDQPLGYSQSNGTDRAARAHRRAAIPARRSITSKSPTAPPKPTTCVALSQLRPGDAVAMEVPNYMQMPGVARSLGATVRRSACGRTPAGSPTGKSSSARSRRARGSSTSRIPTIRPASVLSDDAMRADRRAVRGDRHVAAVRRGVSRRRDRSSADQELLGPERPGDRHERTVEGVRHSRRPHRLDRRPARVVAQCWTQHDYLTIGPNKMSDRIARVAVRAGESRALLRAHARDPARTTCRSPASGSTASAAGSPGASRRPARSRWSTTSRGGPASNSPNGSGRAKTR